MYELKLLINRATSHTTQVYYFKRNKKTNTAKTSTQLSSKTKKILTLN